MHSPCRFKANGPCTGWHANWHKTAVSKMLAIVLLCCPHIMSACRLAYYFFLLFSVQSSSWTMVVQPPYTGVWGRKNPMERMNALKQVPNVILYSANKLLVSCVLYLDLWDSEPKGIRSVLLAVTALSWQVLPEFVNIVRSEM